MTQASFGRRLVDGVTMFVVTGLSLLLLVYVGFGEGKRIYEQFQTEKLVAHGRIVQNAMENYLRAGLPLKQYAGFSTLADPIVQSLEDIDAMAVYDQTGHQLSSSSTRTSRNPSCPKPSRRSAADQAEHRGRKARHLPPGRPAAAHPVRNGRQPRHHGIRRMSSTSVCKAASSRCSSPCAGLSALFAIFVVFTAPYLARARAPWLQIGYAVTFLIMAGLVVGTLINLYSDGVQGKAKASASTLSQRLSDIVDFNLRLRDFDGLDKVLRGLPAAQSRNQRRRPDHRRHRSRSPPIPRRSARRGSPIRAPTNTRSRLTPSGRAAHRHPHRSRFRWTSSTSASSAACGTSRLLFIASGFLAGLFLQVASSMQRLRFDSSSADALRRTRR